MARSAVEKRPGIRTSHTRTLVLALLIVVCAAVVYGRHVGTGGFIWDDDDYVYENPHLPAADGLKRIWFTSESPQYYPLVFTTFWIEYRLWDLNPSGYHAINLALHALNAVMVWLLLRRLGFPAAYLAALVFAVHPMHVETVAWAAERKNTMSTFFYLLAAAAYFRFDERRRYGWYAAALGAFALALFSKTVTSTLPVALLLVFWWRGRRITVRDIVPLIPMFVMGVIMGIVTGAYEAKHVIGELGLAVSPEWKLTFAERAINAGRVLWFYVFKIVWPHPLTFNYARWEIDATSPWQWLWPVTAAGSVAMLWLLRARIGRGPFAAACFYGVSVAPALGFVNIAPLRFSFVADHFCYLPSLGIIAALAGAGYWVVARLAAARPTIAGTAWRAGALAAAMWLAVLGALAIQQTKPYQTVEMLWRHTLQRNPRSYLARLNLSVLLRHSGRLDEAESQLRQILEDWPQSWEATSGAHTNIGNIYFDRGQYEAALEQYRLGEQGHPMPSVPKFAAANTLLALIRVPEAIAEYRAVLELAPDYAKAHLNLGQALVRAGDLSAAERSLDKAAEYPGVALLAYEARGALLLRLGRPTEAAANLRAVLWANPGAATARANLARALAQMNSYADAITTLREGLLVEPGNRALVPTMASLLKSTGDEAGLTRLLRDALAATSGDEQYAVMLADHLATSPDPQQRNGAEALQLAERILRARPASHGLHMYALNSQAAAYAELGRFGEARDAAQKALALAQAAGNEGLAAELSARLARFEANQPYRSGASSP